MIYPSLSVVLPPVLLLTHRLALWFPKTAINQLPCQVMCAHFHAPSFLSVSSLPRSREVGKRDQILARMRGELQSQESIPLF